MMITVLVFIMTTMLGVICLQWRLNCLKNANLKHLNNKLRLMVDKNTWGKLLLHTSDKELISLLNEINNLLDVHRRKVSDYQRIENSTKKMIANISHDLKTPLTVILGYIERIQAEPDLNHEDRSILFAKVDKKAKEVLELMHKFFDLVRLESGDKELPLTRVDMNEICRKNVLEFYSILTGKGFDVQIAIPDYPVYTLANADALDRILTNLLSNAIQHGGDGKVLGLAVRSDNQHVYVDVWDKGKGIGEFQKDLVFERMYTLEDSRNKSFQGSGLGLTITKKLVERLGGTISLSSIPNTKTIFTIRLKTLNYKQSN
jgi:signal transduction histidine kinase